MSKHKVGRNDPCPCGSNKKYKFCCYPDKTRAWRTASPQESPGFEVKPKETPEPIVHHLVSSDSGNTWKPQPGLVAAQIFGKKTEDIDVTVSEMMKHLLQEMNSLGLSDADRREFAERLGHVDHKLHAVKYHLDNYRQAERDKVAEFGADHKPPTGVQMVMEEPRIMYEVESFLFQVKSCLDVLSRVIEPAFRIRCHQFSDSGDAVINVLQSNCPATLSAQAESMTKLIEDAQEAWIVELVEMRVQITHYSSLEGFNCFVEDPYTGGGIARIHYPTMPNTRRALEYCQDVWDQLLGFCDEFLKLAVEAARTRNSASA